MNPFQYTSEAPHDYACSKCRLNGVKLWRQYQTFAKYIELLCAECAKEDQGTTGDVDADGKIEGSTVVPIKSADLFLQFPQKMEPPSGATPPCPLRDVLGGENFLLNRGR